jgi:3-hydroxyacyl-[acyl-carrier-protein] dehydratase
MPGSLILEGIAQLGGLLLEETVLQQSQRRVKALMSIVEKAKFRQPAYPGDRLEYRAEIISVSDLGGRVRGTALCDGEQRAECSFLFSFHEFENERLERRQREIVSLWMRDL